MPEYKLVYFNGRGLAELSRWILNYGDIPFTDERVERENWPEMKKTIPGGKLPVLEVDNKTLPQSLAIARYLATKADLIPQCPFHAAATDALVETLKEVIIDLYKLRVSEKSEEEKKKDKGEYVSSTLEPMLDRLNKRMEGRDWFITDKITWADLAIGRTVDSLNDELGEVVAKYPAVVSHTQKIKQLPKIKEWLEKRPDTPF